jgi:hypothetical protein
VLILLIFLRVTTLGFGTFFLVSSSITLDVSPPETLITAIPETPGPEERAKIVMIVL